MTIQGSPSSADRQRSKILHYMLILSHDSSRLGSHRTSFQTGLATRSLQRTCVIAMNRRRNLRRKRERDSEDEEEEVQVPVATDRRARTMGISTDSLLQGTSTSVATPSVASTVRTPVDTLAPTAPTYNLCKPFSRRCVSSRRKAAAAECLLHAKLNLHRTNTQLHSRLPLWGVHVLRMCLGTYCLNGLGLVSISLMACRRNSVVR